jgi:hypothetical protein
MKEDNGEETKALCDDGGISFSSALSLSFMNFTFKRNYSYLS